MILKASDNSYLKKKRHRRGKYEEAHLDHTITIRIKGSTLDEFKELVGQNYQKKIRDLMEEFINRQKYTYPKEEEKRQKMLGK